MAALQAAPRLAGQGLTFGTRLRPPPLGAGWDRQAPTALANPTLSLPHGEPKWLASVIATNYGDEGRNPTLQTTATAAPILARNPRWTWDSSLPSRLFASHVLEQEAQVEDGQDAAMRIQNISKPRCTRQHKGSRPPGARLSSSLRSVLIQVAFTGFCAKKAIVIHREK